MHADGWSTPRVTDIVHVLSTEAGYRASPRRPLPDNDAPWPRERFAQEALHDRKGAGRIAMIVEAGALARQPGKQPDLIVVGQGEPVKPTSR